MNFNSLTSLANTNTFVKSNEMQYRKNFKPHNIDNKNKNCINNNFDMNIIERFPFIKLSYDKIIHTKVYSDLFCIIPKGNKFYLWITYNNDKNVCILMSISRNGTIQNFELYSLCFCDSLALGKGTILYGTIFEVDGFKHFSCEDIYYYKGKKIEMMTCISKLNLLKDMFTYYLKPTIFSNKTIIVGLPIYNTNINEIEEISKKLPYKVYGIRHHLFNSVWSQGIYIIKDIPDCIFKVKPLIQQDIYELYCNDYDSPYCIAFIPDYKTSVIMNSLFRNIKENKNLDLLEESDDDDEFQDVRNDKYVYLEKSYYMKCIFNTRFKKWQPIEVVKDKVKVITRKEALLLEQ